ncbi:hypothetical protein ACFYX8_21665 [Streptomyces cyaneofuscatus]|uniref:hypothetical protein n=1 Tax=Streptomyces TaxID=1883 RepID=UPI0003A6A73F|nr:hypothetical protein [Streptomyces sp. ScaeMP-e10]MZF54637.1 hypothetical protein [Streptomyces sp. SID5594]
MRPGPVRPVPVHRTRSVLAALVLAVLTLLGGAPAGAALSVGALNSLASTVAYTPKAPAPAPQTDRTAHPGGGPHHDLRRTRTAPSPAGPGAGGRHARDQQPGPHRPTARYRPTGPHTHTPRTHTPYTHTPHTLQERSPAGDPTTPAPRAGISRAHLTGHAPPPSYEGLLPCPPGPVVPRGQAVRVTAASFAPPSGRRGALPGVRGPPGTSAGPPTGHRPRCSADPASRPL